MCGISTVKSKASLENSTAVSEWKIAKFRQNQLQMIKTLPSKGINQR